MTTKKEYSQEKEVMMHSKTDPHGQRPSLPHEVVTRDGFSFAPNTDKWEITGDCINPVIFNFVDFPCKANLVTALKVALIDILENNNAGTAYDYYYVFKHFAATQTALCDIQLAFIELKNLENYRCRPDVEDYKMAKLRSLLKRWDKRYMSLIAPEALAYLQKIRLSANPNVGTKVQTNDPNDGPFDHQELASLVANLHSEFDKETVTWRELALVKLFIGYGARPKSYAAMKLKDFEKVTANGTDSYSLNVPLCKQGTPVRETFEKWSMHPNLGAALDNYKAALLQKFTDEIHDGTEEDELPLFPYWNNPNVDGFKHHAYPDTLSNEVVKTINRLNVRSARKKGARIKINVYRLRYTLGTRLGELGVPVREIAKVLGHSSTAHAKIYTKRSIEFMERLDKATAEEYAPFVNAFTGKVVGNGEDVRAADGSDLPLVANVGNCGKPGACLARLAGCYVCPTGSFYAFEDGPHEEKRTEMIQERERLIALGDVDKLIIEVLDLSIYAVTEVILKCQVKKQSKGDK